MDEQTSANPDGAAPTAPAELDVVSALRVIAEFVMPPASVRPQGCETRPESWVTLAEAARHAKVAPDTLRRYVRQGKIRHGTFGSDVRTKLSWVDEFLLASSSEREAKTETAEDISPEAREIVEKLSRRGAK